MKRIGQTDINKTVALAGIYQAAHLVSQAAFNHRLNRLAYQSSIESLFKLELPNVESLFRCHDSLKLGLFYLIHYTTGSSISLEEKQLLRYLFRMSKMAKKVLKNRDIFEQLQRRLQSIGLQARHLGSMHEIVIRELGLLYRQVFLSRGIEIPVLGKRSSFTNPQRMSEIYALLLAGIRAAVLWQQVGGSVFPLLFSRAQLKKQAIYLLKHEWGTSFAP